MNKISELRQRVRQNGSAVITADEYDKLQEEWITRCHDRQTELGEIERLLAVVTACHQEIYKRDAEIERLRAELAGMTSAWRNACNRGDKAVAELAAAKALLREALLHLDDTWGAGELCNTIHAALGDEP